MQDILILAIQTISKALTKISYSVTKEGVVTMDFNLETRSAANEVARNWWKSIRDELKEPFYFEVGCTWVDNYGEVFKESVSSHNFPHKAGSIKPHQITFPTKPKAKLRLTSVGDISKIG